MTGPTRLRERDTVTAEIRALAGEVRLPSGFRAGAVAALRWVTGGVLGPLTGTPEPTMRSIVAELSAAEAVIYGRPSPQRDFAIGVEHALLWAELATPTPPSERTFPPGTCENTPSAEVIDAANGRSRRRFGPSAPP